MSEEIKVAGKNKGEWSEYYVLLKILADQRLYAADKDLNKNPKKFYPVLSAVTAKGSPQEMTYTVNDKDDDVKIYNPRTKTFDSIKKTAIRDKLGSIFDEIKLGKHTFQIPTAKEIIEKLNCERVSSGGKNDLFLVIHDYMTGIEPEVGFSIKSKAGSDATLLNATNATNFIFRLTKSDIDYHSINAVDKKVTKNYLIERIKRIYSSGSELEFVKPLNETFAKSLGIIDSSFSKMIAEMLIYYYAGEKRSRISEIVKYLEKENPLGKEDSTWDSDYYAPKLKHFLAACALGLTPSKSWDGSMQAMGGYIIVLKDGEIVCYHLINLDDFKDYLFENTRLEKGKHKKHNYGVIYKENGELFINLNLQIRFIKQKKVLEPE